MTSLGKKTARNSAVIAVAALAIGSGTAFAYWTSTGSGTGAATTGTDTAWAVTVSAPTATDGTSTPPLLVPGGVADRVAVQVQNTASGPQHLNGVTMTVANSDGTPWTAVPGCSAADYQVSTGAAVPSGDLAAGATASGWFTVQMVDSTSDQDACKNVSVPLYVKAS